MFGQASDDVIKQAQALRQNFRLSVRGSLLRQRPLHMSIHEYEFHSLPAQDKTKTSPKRSPIFHKLSQSIINSDRVTKHPSSNRSLKHEVYAMPFSVKTIEQSDFRTKERDVFIKKHKFALNLHLPMPEYRPISQESIISKSSAYINKY
ncbi:hypothetical protein SteCoe_35528 [Stentor coeruleus]|uniref:Uncharacterized protein n=1 Tax=Stentor coeruleus TaxID=5963 RepID=A0A1R2AS32_9CILI|nr:hypothetical protein SteCoe_35528 [Stentor coeruleus]